jgi:phosphoadenosine phosphosulfate reductase
MANEEEKMRPVKYRRLGAESRSVCLDSSDKPKITRHSIQLLTILINIVTISSKLNLSPPGRNMGNILSPDDRKDDRTLAEQLQPTPELLEELRRCSDEFETATPQQILRWAVDRFAPRFTMATAFGPEGMVILHLLAEIAPDTPIFNLDTGYQFPETLELRERVKQRYGMEVEFKRPELTVEQFEALHGGPLYKRKPDQCCGERKIRVLHEAIRGMHAWASGIRRDQSPDRAKAAIVSWDRKFGLVKVSPLAKWTKKDVWKMIVDHDIPYNPLHDQGYTSIGSRKNAQPEASHHRGRARGTQLQI